jgi:uncharacterized repeat protein (TIGR03943 family)
MMKRAAYSVVFVLLGVFLLWRYATGTLVVYVHPRFNGLILAAAVTALILGIASARPRRQNGHEADRGMSWFGVLMVGGAAVVGLLITPQSLGSAAAATRGLNMPAVREPVAAATALTAAVVSAPLHATITNLYEGFHFLRDGNAQNQSQEGVNVDVTGFVFRDAESIRDYVYVARFTIVCCAADASPVGMLVRSPDAPALKKDSWVHVRGRITGGTLEYEPGRYVSETYVQAETVEPVAAPKDPYIYLR